MVNFLTLLSLVSCLVLIFGDTSLVSTVNNVGIVILLALFNFDMLASMEVFMRQEDVNMVVLSSWFTISVVVVYPFIKTICSIFVLSF